MTTSLFILIEKQILQRPAMQVEDIYKLLYQGTMGVGHLLSRPQVASDRLKAEMATTENVAISEALVEDITIDQPMVRINLRPYATTGLPTDLLLTGMLQTEHVFSPSLVRLIQAWNEYREMEEKHCFPGERKGISPFNEHLSSARYPVQHHSPIYRKCYHPSYRIMAKSVFLNIFSHRLQDIAIF